MTKSKGILGPRAEWSEDQLDMLRRFYPDRKTEDLATLIGRSVAQVYRKAAALGLKKSAAYLASEMACRLRRGDNIGAEHRFQKGGVVWNKGMKGLQLSSPATRFKPGQQPHNTLPIGSLKFDKNETLLRKVSEAKGNNSKRWRAVHELVWVEANGPVPPKHIVVFKPGTKTNVLEEITLDKVECLSLANNMRRNTLHNMPKELAQLVQLRGVINRKINAREKQNGKQH